MPDTRHNAVPDSANGSPDSLEEDMSQLKIGDNKQEGAGDDKGNQLPERPGEPECTYYMKNGTCGFGSNCKYNHPTYNGQRPMYRDELPQRDGQPDCQFYLKTGTCKFGLTCKYHHPRTKHDGQLIELNILGLPMRKDEKPCPYYMRTSSCKFGVACKFNHPQPSTFGAMVPASSTSIYNAYTSSLTPAAGLPVGGPSPWLLPRNSPRMQAHSAYLPVSLPPNLMQQGWGTYLGNLGIPVANAANSYYHGQPSSSTPVLLPERPGQPECQIYLKTGSCKYGPSCKYDHPKDRNQPAACPIGPLGLPLRPGFPVCDSYTAYGSCTYGTTCKFDHPILGYYNYALPTVAIQEAPMLVPNQNGLHMWTSPENSSKATKASDELVNSERSVEIHDIDNSEHHGPSTQAPPSHTALRSDSPQHHTE